MVAYWGYVLMFSWLSSALQLAATEADDDRTTTNDAGESENCTSLWFDQILDHFNPTENGTWKQRYLINSDYFTGGAPVFLYISGEEEMTSFSDGLNESWEKNAVNHSALMFKVEHRFYGKSQPTGGNFSIENLKLLSSQQALADLAHFIVAMNRGHNLPKDTKWIVFGCSYGGTLATWLRYKYPHLVFGAVASSAPVRATVNFPEYYHILGEAFMFYGNITNNETMGEKCLKTLKETSRELESLSKTPEGMNSINQMFDLTDPNNTEVKDVNKTDIPTLFDDLFTLISIAVQGNSYDEYLEKWSVEKICDTLVNETVGRPIERFAEVYKTLVKENENMTEEDDALALQWSYQSCSEFGFFQTSDNDSFVGNHITLKYFFDDCKDKFGEIFTEKFIRRAVDHTNTMYGGQEVDISRVVSIHGNLDPWHVLGLTATTNPLSSVIMIEGASHCADTGADSYYDTASLRAARENVSDILYRWLQ